MSSFTEFFSFTDPNVRYVVLGCILLMASSAVVGCFTFLRKRALVGDAISHSVLPGVCLAFMLSGTKNPLYLLIGAFITGWISIVVIDYVTTHSRIKKDTAIGLVLSVFFGFGVVLLTRIQQSGNASQAGLDKFLFGEAASLVGEDLVTFGVLAVLLIAVIVLFFRAFTLISFDRNYAVSLGYPVRFLELLLTTLTVFAIVVGIQAVGVVLMAAILITPAAAARYWTDSIAVMIPLAALFAAFSGVTGAYISYTSENMPTGPWIVMVLSIIAILSFIIAPGKGILSRLVQGRKNRFMILEENILKVLYHLGEKENDFFKMRSKDEIQNKRPMAVNDLNTGLKRLHKKRLVTYKNGKWQFTEPGKEKGERITRLHRLWELYLTKYLNIAPDHVHEDAETIEHILTPEIEEKLRHMLEYPEEDPHASRIPDSGSKK